MDFRLSCWNLNQLFIFFCKRHVGCFFRIETVLPFAVKINSIQKIHDIFRIYLFDDFINFTFGLSVDPAVYFIQRFNGFCKVEPRNFGLVIILVSGYEIVFNTEGIPIKNSIRNSEFKPLDRGSLVPQPILYSFG